MCFYRFVFFLSSAHAWNASCPFSVSKYVWILGRRHRAKLSITWFGICCLLGDPKAERPVGRSADGSPFWRFWAGHTRPSDRIEYGRAGIRRMKKAASRALQRNGRRTIKDKLWLAEKLIVYLHFLEWFRALLYNAPEEIENRVIKWRYIIMRRLWLHLESCISILARNRLQ